MISAGNLRERILDPVDDIVQAGGFEDVARILFSNLFSGWGGPEVFLAHLAPVAEFVVSPPADDFLIVPVRGVVDLEWRLADQNGRARSYPGRLSVQTQGSLAAFRWNAPVENLYVRLTSVMLEDTLQTVYRGDPLLVRLLPTIDFNDPLLEQLALTLLGEAQAGNPAGRLYIEAMGFAFVAHLLYRYSSMNLRRTLTPKPYGLSDLQLNLVMAFVDSFLSQPISLTDMAALVGLSPYYFARQFKRKTGYAPHEYVIQVRVEHARQLLSEGRMTVAEVAHAVGFSDQSKLSLHFKRIVGVSPNTILKDHQKRKM